MIEELIKKLEADAQSEQSQKDWCDKETKNAKVYAAHVDLGYIRLPRLHSEL